MVSGTRDGVVNAVTAVVSTASSALFYAAPRYAATQRGAMAARHDYLLRRLAAERGLRSDGDVDTLVRALQESEVKERRASGSGATASPAPSRRSPCGRWRPSTGARPSCGRPEPQDRPSSTP